MRVETEKNNYSLTCKLFVKNNEGKEFKILEIHENTFGNLIVIQRNSEGKEVLYSVIHTERYG